MGPQQCLMLCQDINLSSVAFYGLTQVTFKLNNSWDIIQVMIVRKQIEERQLVEEKEEGSRFSFFYLLCGM